MSCVFIKGERINEDIRDNFCLRNARQKIATPQIFSFQQIP